MTTAPDTTPEELDAVLERAAAAAPLLAALTPGERAGLLRAVADALDGAADRLVPLAAEEAHYPEARCKGELGRTTFQLRLFAQTLEDGSYLEAAVDPADPEWGTPRPDVRRILVPLGPVVVFGASNFPFAFATAGGDSAS
ncbi:aldehyde dehydrogenase family protein, partial [Nocardiopsis tropica]